MAYLYQLYVVVNKNEEDYSERASIESKIDYSLSTINDIDVVGTIIKELDFSVCGRCCNCGAWVSDQKKDSHIEGFSDGCIIGESWWCDICLPPDHPKSFRKH